MADKLFVGGLSFSTSSRAAARDFRGGGSCRVSHGRHGPPDRAIARFRFVEMATPEDADAAISRFQRGEGGRSPAEGRAVAVDGRQRGGGGGGDRDRGGDRGFRR